VAHKKQNVIRKIYTLKTHSRKKKTSAKYNNQRMAKRAHNAAPPRYVYDKIERHATIHEEQLNLGHLRDYMSS
jgi:hypothetical protein